MFLGKNTKKARSLSLILGLLVAVICGGASVTKAQTPTPTPKVLYDFQGNGRTSFTTLAFNTGGSIRWKVTGNPAAPGANQAFKREFDYGLADSDSVTAGDYSGDRKSELSVWRDTNGTYYNSQFPTGTGPITLERAVVFGNGASDVPVVGDYDGDGKADFALARVVSGNLVWYILGSSSNTMRTVTFGLFTNATNPAVFPGADFNGDGRDDLIYLTTNAAQTQVNYFIGDSISGAGIITRTYGNYSTDTSLAPADYTGDGKADFVAVRQTQGDTEVWYIQNSVTGAVTATRFGIADATFTDLDIPSRGDYDGDGKADICVWRASNQNFYYISSINGSIQGQKSGDAGDFPLAGLAGF